MGQTDREVSRRWVIGGKVQGVGFRPFVCRLAFEYQLRGWVKNQRDSVEVVAQGRLSNVTQFFHSIFSRAPFESDPVVILEEDCPIDARDSFTIETSDEVIQATPHVLPDFDVCSACLDDLFDPNNRRYQYPFTQCAQCGPRYSAIYTLPYDRQNTSLQYFSICEECRGEYDDLQNRRFHAQNQACSLCGPNYRLRYCDFTLNDINAIVDKLLTHLSLGNIAAIKGLGGYHYVADATNSEAVIKLRELKHRPHKPFAVMFPDHDNGVALRRSVTFSSAEWQLLSSRTKPVVLLRPSPNHELSAQIAPGLATIGTLLPYTPFYHLLMRAWSKPLVVTSANVSGEPILYRNDDENVLCKNESLMVVSHPRPIVRPVEDSVAQVIDSRIMPIRLGRGMAPLELESPITFSEPVLALGGHLKNSVALGWGDRIVLSSYTGDLSSVEALASFESTIKDLCHLYQVEPKVFLADAHPHYAQVSWASRRDIVLTKVHHHRAHASAIYSDYNVGSPSIVFTWDGTGFGEDGTLWGGETFVGTPGCWQRVASLRPFRLIGGERASQDVRRVAASLLLHCDPQNEAVDENWRLVWQKGVNSPLSSSIGRLFDGAAALIGIRGQCTYEAQAAMELESIADESIDEWIPCDMTVDVTGILRIDWRLLVDTMQNNTMTPSRRAAIFHNSLAQMLIEQVRWAQSHYAVESVGLSGGVFQNRFLLRRILQALSKKGVNVILPQRVPINDNGLAVGQLIEYAATVNTTLC